MLEITKIWWRLYLGSMFDAQRLAKANPHGLTHVVSLSENAPITTRSEVTYVHLPVEDEIAIPPARFNAIMDAISSNIRQGKVLLHCGSGISRGPIMAAAYLHCVGYKEFDAALQDIALLRGFISPSAILLASVRDLLK
jgi:protein-tyrosine phosphatase